MDISKDIFQVDAEIAHAWTLPAELYTDPSILLAEKERLFSRTWQVVGHRSQVAGSRRLLHHGIAGRTFVVGARQRL